MSDAPYNQIASEYYEPDHRTSRNFDQATAAALCSIATRVPQDGLVLDIGCGRGRSAEFLGVDPRRVVQLDSSAKMLALQPREACALRICHRAESLPFLNEEFACVTAFLCDPYLGLEFLGESHRVLRERGVFVATTPSYEWGAPLRTALGISTSMTRFITRNGKVLVPSVLVPQDQLVEMLKRVGFDERKFEVTRHRLPHNAQPISPDISNPAVQLGIDVHDLDIIYVITAEK